MANDFNGTIFNLDSKIYKWDGSNFVEAQTIETKGATDWEHFEIEGNHYLVVANTQDGSNFNTNSKIYRWNGSSFMDFQIIATNGAQDWEYFTVGGDHYLVLANFSNNVSNSIDSKLYKWNGTNFAEFQPLGTIGAAHWRYFTFDDHYIAIANRYNGSSYNLNSKIYKATFLPTLNIDKQVSDPAPKQGQTVTYTVVISNIRGITATNTVISDTLSNNLTFVGPVKLESPQPGAILATSASNLPTLASQVTVGPGQQITLTFPAQVKPEVANGTTIVNTASASSTEATIPVSDGVSLGVNFPVLGIRKQVNDIIPQAGQTVTYTLVISNSGEIAATNTVISDTLSNNLIFVGPVKLEPPQPGAILATSAGNLPTLASGVTVGPGQQITLTVPVQVKPEVADDTTIVNTASASSEKVVGYVSDVVELTVTAKKINVYLPVVSSCKSALPVFVCLGP